MRFRGLGTIWGTSVNKNCSLSDELLATAAFHLWTTGDRKKTYCRLIRTMTWAALSSAECCDAQINCFSPSRTLIFAESHEENPRLCSAGNAKPADSSTWRSRCRLPDLTFLIWLWQLCQVDMTHDRAKFLLLPVKLANNPDVNTCTGVLCLAVTCRPIFC